MRFLILAVPAALWAQSTTTIYQTGVNGQRVAVSMQDQTSTGDRAKRIQSTDGRPIPAEQTTERVLRDDAGGKTVERTVQRYDATGRPSSVEKVLVEEIKLPGGSSNVTETRSASDLSGHFSPVERRTTENRVNGQTVTSNVRVDWPTPNHTFQTAERRSTVTVGPPGKQQSTEIVERADAAGRFRAVGRTESTTATNGAKSTQNTAVYELDSLGKMNLAKQTVATTTKGPNGDVTETSVYSSIAVGRTITGTDKLELREQQFTERRIGSDGSVTEVVRVRTANPRDPGKLGDAQTVSETVCTGKCLPASAAAPVAAVKPAADAKGAAPAKP